IIYPSERDPTNLFEALSRLQRQGVIGSDSLNLILRASHHENYLKSLIDRYGIGTIVSLAPPIPYREALQEMLEADGLLLLQSANCNNQIPAKLYEYLRAQRPILALTDPAGDTAAKLESMEGGIVARLDSTDAIMDALKRFIMYLGENRAPIASLDKVLSNSRESTAFTLARLLDTIIASNRNN
ncbi:MAG TPA: glycosyltransferase, partial [Nitrosomonas halophila]|nr:glycosyltransferase [Nitrosomonas halophila]